MVDRRRIEQTLFCGDMRDANRRSAQSVDWRSGRLLGLLPLLIALLATGLGRELRAEAPKAKIVGLGATTCEQFLVIVSLAAISLGTAPRAHWDRMIVGDEWLECLLSIPIIAIVPFAGSIWAVRKGAPTNLVRAGAFAGLVAGGVSAMAYALHCTDDSLPFIAVWYGGTIVLCTLPGPALGPRLLRW
jgi:hypothetical protein